MKIESAIDYIGLLKIVSFHNNLDIGVIDKLYDNQLIICNTRRFWNEHGRSISGEAVMIDIPTYKYNYFNKYTGKAIRYGELTAKELKQAVKTGVIEKRATLKGCKKMQIYGIDSTSGKAFNTEDYEINIVNIMKEIGQTDVEYLVNSLVSEQRLDTETSKYLKEALNYILGIEDLRELPNEEKVRAVIVGLASILNEIDSKIGRRKLIDIRRESLEELTDTIICSIDARNVRALIGGE